MVDSNSAVRPDTDDLSHPYIKRILLENFMCHTCFEIDLNKRLNLIYGENGSGKSTILTAIMVALGSRASTTSRGESLGGLVKTGAHRARISVEIHVPQEHRHIHSKYGDSVTVVRTINATGASQYQLRDGLGRKVPKAGAKDVRVICHHFGLYPDNELAMLSQENAKEFLVRASARKKYDKLQKALLHHIILKNQEEVAALETDQQALLSLIREREESLELQNAHNQEVLSRANEQANRERQVRVIKNICAWRKVDQVAEEYEELERKHQHEYEQLSSLNEGSSVEAEVTQLRDQIDTKNAELQDLSNEREDARLKIAQLEQELQSPNYVLTRSEEDLRSYRNQLVSDEQELRTLEESQAAQSSDKLEKRRQNLQETKDFNMEQRRAVNDTKLDLIQTIKDLKESRSGQATLLQKLLKEKNEIVARQKSVQDELQSGLSKSPSKNPLLNRHRQLRKLVNKHKEWRSAPVGPLYEYIELNDEGASFSPALERLWTNTLESWWVQNSQDRDKLMQLARQTGFNNLKIIMRNDDAYDFQNALPTGSSNYSRVVDIMSVKLEAIKRILVDLHQIESCILVKGIDSAFACVDANPKITNAIALSVSSRGSANYTQISQTTTRRDANPIRPHELVRLVIGTKARQLHTESKLRELASQLQEVEEKISEQQQTLSTTDAKLAEETRKLQKAENKDRRLEDEIRTATQELLALETGSGVEDYAIDISRLKSSTLKLNTSIQQVLSVMKESEERVAEISAKLTETSSIVTRCTKAILDIKHDIQVLEKNSEALHNKDKQRERKLRRQEATVKMLERELRAKLVQLEDIRETADGETGPRLHGDSETSDETMSLFDKHDEELAQTLRKLHAEARVVAASAEEIAQAERESLEILETRAQINSNRKEMEHLIKFTKERQSMRQVNERAAWSRIKARIKFAFARLLQRRKFVGQVTIDDAKRHFSVQAAPAASTSDSVTTLSGGEKSLTQLALLMSVWETMQVGLVAMDEYDVFMDKSNRSTSLLFVGESIQDHKLQCILITPQDVDTSALRNVEHKVHKLNPAR